MRRGIAVVAALAIAVPVAWGVANRGPLSSFPSMPSAYEAKEYCSCRWVSGRDDAFCDRFVRQSVVPTQGREVDEGAKRVTARALWVSHTAEWTGPRTGCVVR